jgi:hypothetical protein
MDILITDFISGIDFGEVQGFKNLQIIPLFTEGEEGLVYLTLKEALEKRLLVVKEVSAEASVPELKVINNADVSVLLLDGEELAGAKQNRVLNTSILVKKKSELIIPVSCTEQGRWSYQTDEFSNSENILSHKIRGKKAASVSDSLEESGSFDSDQGAIWNDIQELSASAEIHSPTGAMKDIFEGKKNDLEEYIKAFQYLPHQKGMFVFMGGEVAGWDMLSRESAFEVIFPKLVKSYALDAVLEKKKKKGSSKKPMEEAKRFLQEIKDCKEKKYPSSGQGWDYRFEGEDKVGSALVYRQKIIHMAFFKISKEERVGRMSGYKRRRGYRV